MSSSVLIRVLDKFEDIYFMHYAVPGDKVKWIEKDLQDYGYLGFSHWAEDDIEIMSCFDNIKKYHPENEKQLKSQYKDFLYNVFLL